MLISLRVNDAWVPRLTRYFVYVDVAILSQSDPGHVWPHEKLEGLAEYI
jgi:hypothetical protein